MRSCEKKRWCFLTFVFAFIIICIGTVCFAPKTPHGFGIDSEGRVYLGRNGYISIYENGIETDTISSPTNRGYYMTITDDIIIIGTGTHRYQLALDGTVISSEDDPKSETINTLQYQKTCSLSSGCEYRLEYCAGRLCITEEGTSVFVVPLTIQMQPIIEVVIPIGFILVIFFLLCYYHTGIKLAHEKISTK